MYCQWWRWDKATLARNVTRRNVVHVHYIVGTYTLHNLHTGLRNTIEAVLQKEKGQYHMILMQMIHGAYNIQNWQETDELKDI